MAITQVAFLISLAVFCSAIDYRPVFYPGPCPNVPPSQNFDEKSILNKYYATYYTNPSFRSFHCLTNHITKTGNGIQFNAKFYNESQHEFTYTNQLKSTPTPGVYDVSYKLPHDESIVISGKEVFYSLANEVLVWGCTDDHKSNKHAECTFVFSKLPSTSSASLNALKKYLKQNGASADTFYQAKNRGCQN